jgi:FlaG/FlaF family flagellin (archaellin)
MRGLAWGPRGTRVPEDEAVSPVIGMILVLGISIVGTASILYWGLPAIDEMKANVEYRSMEGQFTELDSTLKELAAGTTEKTAKRWQPSLNRGEIGVRNGTQGWLFATDMYSATVDYDLGWSSFADGDNAFTLHNLGALPLALVKVECYTVVGTSSLSPINVSVTQGSAVQMTGANLDPFAPGGTKTLYLYAKDVTPATAVPISGATFKCRVFSGSTLVAESWYANTGSINYDLRAGIGRKSLVENNGALLEGDGSAYAITNTPPIPPPTQTGGVYRFFGRSLVLHGNASFAGDDQFDLLVSLYSTSVLASYDCALASKADCVETSKIYVFGDLKDPWYVHLTNSAKGYAFVEKTLPGGSGVEYLEERRAHMGYTLLQSTILMSG